MINDFKQGSGIQENHELISEKLARVFEILTQLSSPNIRYADTTRVRRFERVGFDLLFECLKSAVPPIEINSHELEQILDILESLKMINQMKYINQIFISILPPNPKRM